MQLERETALSELEKLRSQTAVNESQSVAQLEEAQATAAGMYTNNTMYNAHCTCTRTCSCRYIQHLYWPLCIIMIEY